MKQGALRRKYTHDCDACGATYHPDGRSSKFCSRECAAVGHTLPRPICERCGKQRQDRKHSLRRFCGRECASAAVVKQRPTCHVCGITVTLGAIACVRHHHAEKRERRRRVCPTCNGSYVPDSSLRASTYCSYACYRTAAALRPAMIEVACHQCGATFRRTRGAVRRTAHQYCSRACLAASNAGANNAGWRGGKQPGYRGPGWQRLAESIRERDGYRCRRCGKTQDDEGARLSVDHIIPYRSFDNRDEANEPANLVVLCRSCHGKKARAERRWLRGDVLDMWTYQIAVAEPWSERAS